jgi:hypothetical protein
MKTREKPPEVIREIKNVPEEEGAGGLATI